MESDQRKLAVILHADVIGSTGLVQKDESLAHERIVGAFKRFSNTIKSHGGIAHEIRGDALLAEFPRASDAVAAAMEFQKHQLDELKHHEDDIRPELRVGIAMGEVVIADNTMTGAGIVMAQRLEQLADAGGTIIQGAVYETLPRHLPFSFESLGKQRLKGFDESVEAYRVRYKDSPKKTVRKHPPYKIITATAALLLVLAVALVWYEPWRSNVPTSETGNSAKAVSEKPSIAVLPFNNISNDAEQEYFADGLTEDLITDLSKVSGLFVIARNSVFTYKDKAVKVTEVAEELGVRYVLEGSVRRAGNLVRINAQLIDATTGGHLWAERYDGSLADVFAMQDEVNRKIITALSIELSNTESTGASHIETSSTEAHDAYLKGWEHYRRQTPENHAIARDYLKQALDFDPDYSRALAALAALYWEVHLNVWSPALRESEFTVKDTAIRYLERALVNPTPLAYVVESRIHLRHGRHEEAVATANQALELSSNDADAQIALARALILSGLPQESLGPIEVAERLDPFAEARHQLFRGMAQFGLQNYTAAAKSLDRSFRLNSSNALSTAALAAAYGHLKQKEKAQSAWQAFVDSEFTEFYAYNINSVLSFFPYKHIEDKERIAAGLRLAGVPESNVEQDQLENTR